MNETCVNCNRTKEKGQFWFLKNYYGFSGIWCCECYAKISHDGYGKPKNQAEYVMLLLKQEKRDGKG